MPDMEIDEELLNMDLTENFVIDVEQVEKIYALLSGQEIETVAEDESVALEEDSVEEPENADLDDLPPDEDPDAVKEESAAIEAEENFEDDLPWEGEDEEKPVRRTRTMRKKTGTPRKKTAVVKKAPAKKKATAPKNGRRKKATAPKKAVPTNGRKTRRSGKAQL